MRKTLVIHCITYNHFPFIKDALDSFLMQETDFPFEIYVSDDASTDNTPSVLKEYANKYPDKIKIFLHKKNQGVMKNFIELAGRISSEYVCLCEGDDYWTDPLKLQKQKNFLDNHPDYSLVFHPARILWEDGSHHNRIWGPSPEKDYGTFDQQIWDRNIIPTLSVMYRWRFNKAPLSLLSHDILPIDWYVHRLHAQVGKIGFLPEIMGVYRKHSGGIFYHQFNNDSYFINNFWKIINTLFISEKNFFKDYSLHIAEVLYNLTCFYKKNPDSKLFSILQAQNPTKWEELLKRFINKNGSNLVWYLKWKLCFVRKIRKENKRKFISLKIRKDLKAIYKKTRNKELCP